MYIPPGFSAVTPYFFIDGADKFVLFLKAAFDARELGRTLMPDGKVANARVQIAQSIFMVSDIQGKHRAMPSAYYLYVENADLSMKKALEAGAKLEMDVMNMPYGDRQGGVIDPFGNIWWISQRLVSTPYDV